MLPLLFFLVLPSHSFLSMLVSIITRQKCVYLFILFQNKASIVRGVGVNISGVESYGDRVVAENLVHIAGCQY